MMWKKFHRQPTDGRTIRFQEQDWIIWRSKDCPLSSIMFSISAHKCFPANLSEVLAATFTVMSDHITSQGGSEQQLAVIRRRLKGEEIHLSECYLARLVVLGTQFHPLWNPHTWTVSWPWVAPTVWPPHLKDILNCMNCKGKTSPLGKHHKDSTFTFLTLVHVQLFHHALL